MFFLFRSPKTVAQLAHCCNKPWKLGMWLWHRVWYKSDLEVHGKREYWQDPEETLKRRTGDCEDFAILAKAALTKLGYRPFLLGVFPERGVGHVVCCYLEPKRLLYYTIDNKKGNKKRAHHMWDVPGKVMKNWKVWRIYGNTKKDVIEEWVMVGKEARRIIPKDAK